MTTSALAAHLEHDGFGPTFAWPQHDLTVATIWAAAGAAALEEVVRDRTAPGHARLVAAEVLFRYDFSFIDRVDLTEVARIYARALRANLAGAANAWGLLWDGDDLGPLGGRFIILDAAAVPVLIELLDDATVVDWYAGSEEATLGNGRRYRIKDFAAFYLARLRNLPLPFAADPAARDQLIDGLRRDLAR